MAAVAIRSDGTEKEREIEREERFIFLKSSTISCKLKTVWLGNTYTEAKLPWNGYCGQQQIKV